MGLPSDLTNLASDSIPILLVALAVHGVCYVKSLLYCLLHTIGLSRFFPPTAADDDALPGSILVDEHANVSRWVHTLREEEEEKNDYWVDEKKEEEEEDKNVEVECVVCLNGMRAGEQVRRLACCHVFHRACLDGWFDQQKTSCPLCRAPLPFACLSLP